MDGLDFSALSDDQLLGLVRAALREITRRDPALASAAESAMLDEAERARVAAAAGDREAAKLRAAEREQIAREAAERVRAADAAARGDRAAAAAREKAARDVTDKKNWLRAAAGLVDKKPSEISLLFLATKYGRRVLINEGADRYSTDHLVDWNRDTGAIKTIKPLIGRKPDLAALAARFAAEHGAPIVISGTDLDWTGDVA